MKLVYSIFASAAFIFASQASAAEFCASVYGANSWLDYGYSDIGMYRFSTDSYSRETVKLDSDLDASGGGAMTEDFYFCTSELDFGYFVDVTHYIVNPESWNIISTLRDGDRGSVATDLAYDNISMKIYGCFNGDEEGDPMVFGTIDPSNGYRQFISEINVPWIACSFDRNGQLYAVDMAGALMKINRVNGEVTELGNLGFTAARRSTGAIDPETGIFYVVVTNPSEDYDEEYYPAYTSKLYAVDVDAVSATEVYEFGDGEALGGMFFPGPTAPDGAPAGAEDFYISFADGMLSGTVLFTVPTTTFDGAELIGDVSYLLRANGDLLAQGTAQPGEHLELWVTVAEADTYEVELQLSNVAGRGPKSAMTIWIGEDTPTPITSVDAVYNGSGFIVNWDAPIGSQHGGWYDPAKIRYTVTRHPDDMVVADHITENTLTDNVEGTGSYSYEVVMSYGDKEYGGVSSPVVRLGSEALPYHTTFEDEDSMADFIVLDADGDHIEWYREWEFYVELTDELIPAAVFPYSSSNNADDWLFTPPFNLLEGKEYELSIMSLTDYEGDEPALEILCGSAPEPSAMETVISESMHILSLLPEEHSFKFTVPSDGLYYIGFHACSEPYRSAIALTEISLEESGTVGISSADIVKEKPVLFTIDGRRADSVKLAPGLYITSDGRKLIIR